MTRQVITGYCEPISLCPGEHISFKVSTHGDYSTKIVKLTGNGGADSSSPKEETIDSDIEGVRTGKTQSTNTGSYALVPNGILKGGHNLSFELRVWPTLLSRPNQFLMGQWSASEYRGIGLVLVEKGKVAAIVGDGTRSQVIEAPGRCNEREWFLIRVELDIAQGQIEIATSPIDKGSGELCVAEVSTKPEVEGLPFTLAACCERSCQRMETAWHYNGKIENPKVWMCEHRVDSSYKDNGRGKPVAAWDFGKQIGTDAIIDVSGNGHNGLLVNCPARAMKSSAWDGTVHDWRQHPEHYCAIHFHEDDLYDAGWSEDFSWKIPQGLGSGVFAAKLEAENSVRYLPFFVRGVCQGKPRSRIAVLFPTASYLAYGNEHLALDVAETEMLSGHLSVLREDDCILATHRDLGLSLYDRHADGSGVAYSSRLRPILNFNPTARSSWIGADCPVPWQFPADLDIVEFLEHYEFGYEVITDEDLHERGKDILESYEVIVTGTHPEYCSTRMHRALSDYLAEGGRLAYLGGNGFYWRIAYSDSLRGMIELRRAEDGIRDWVAEPGEYYLGFTGELGGLWRRLGRPPQSLVGVGMAGQGFDRSGCYRLTDSSKNKRVEFAMKGLSGREIFGDFGSVGGGAAGLELDRSDRDLGTPPHALVIGQSMNHSNLTYAVPEEVDNVSDLVVAPRNRDIRSDIVFFETPAGGAVFSVGSIAWAGSLSWNEYRNDVATMTYNVIKRFCDPEPFVYPVEGQSDEK